MALSEYTFPALGVAHQALEEINPAGDNILIQGVTAACVLQFIPWNVMQCRMWPHRITWYWACKDYGSNKNVRQAITCLCTILPTPCRLAADIVESRLERAQKMGADVVINCSKENLKERGSPLPIPIPVPQY